jgi:hypothetical protein
MIDWDIENLRITLFAREQIAISDSDWHQITGQSEAETRRAGSTGIRRLSGKFLGGLLTISSAPDRCIVAIQQDTKPEDIEQPTFPILGKWDDLRGSFLNAVFPWISSVKSPVYRLAFGTVLLFERPTRQRIYEEIGKLVPSIRVNSERMQDLMYRINWPQESKLIPGLVINRLTTFSGLQLFWRVFVGDSILQPSGQDAHALRLELDLNTSHLTTTPIDPEQRILILKELMQLAIENAAKGEVL